VAGKFNLSFQMIGGDWFSYDVLMTRCQTLGMPFLLFVVVGWCAEERFERSRKMTQTDRPTSKLFFLWFGQQNQVRHVTGEHE
jgi:hypothetical protein